jgi:CRP-like cAMP-binding protein
MLNEFQAVLNHVSRYIQLTREEEDYFCSLLRTTVIKKKQYIVQPDFVCKYRSYVVKGALRAYLLGNKDQDHTVAFAIEDWWISDFYSYINQEPAALFVQALEDSILIQIDYNAEQLLMQTIPKFNCFFRIVAERAFAFSQRRTLSNLSKSAEERYNEFIHKYPAIVSRVPQYALASYLGFSTEFLSKIRNKQAKKS